MTRALSLFLAAVLSGAAAQERAGIAWESSTRTIAGKPESIDIGRLVVPERHGRPGGKTLTLGFVRLKTTAVRPRAPIIYLDGGPGGSGVSTFELPYMAALYSKLRAVADVIVLSQRGTGISVPRLTCGPSARLPEDGLVTFDRLAAATFPAMRACADRFRANGVDVAAYNTQENADDLEALRRALAVERLSLLGFSYGTHLGMTAMRRHPASFERVVLAGVEGPDETLKLPRVYDEQLARITAIAKADPDAGGQMLDLAGALNALLAKVRQTPIEIELGTGDTRRRLLVGEAGILYILRRDFGDTNDMPWIPSFIYDTLNGRYDQLRAMLMRRLPQLEGGVGLMGLAMDCASGVSKDRLARIRAEEPGSVFGRAVNMLHPEVCEAIGVPALGDDFRAPLVSAIPTLLISGTLDANTPVAQAEAHRRRLSRSAHIIVTNAGHESTLPVPEVQQVILDFFSDRMVTDRVFVVPVPKIRPVRRPPWAARYAGRPGPPGT